MAVSLAVISTDCALLLNAGSAGSYSATITDPRWATQEVVDAVLMADAAVCAAIFKNKENPRAALYYTTQSGLAHGGTIGQSAGPVASVTFVVGAANRPGVEWEKAEIQHEITNTLSLDYDCHYYIDGKIIWHNGAAIAAYASAAVSVNLTYPAFTKTSACQAPDEYAWIVLCGAMSFLSMPEGENVAADSVWVQQFAMGIKMIITGTGAAPEPQNG